MKYWIVPSNDHIFRIGDAIKSQGGMVDWRMSNDFSIGDIVFIYKTKPDQCIRYKMEVVKTMLNEDESFDQEQHWADKDIFYSGLGSFSYVRFKLLETFDNDILSLHHLHEHGLKNSIQGVMRCKNELLLAFLLNPHEKVNDDDYDVDYPEADETLYEGALITVKANKYERNRQARQECVDKKGYKCLVCGRDFVETYGIVGKNFIHVHHLKPISSIGKEYKLNVDEDLVPVCPNCHYMLHRKDPPYTIKQMKRIIAKPSKAFIIDDYDFRQQEDKSGYVPIYSVRAACGYFEEGELPEAEGWVDVSENGFTPNPKKHFVVYAKGDSMRPKISNGDLCVFEWYRGGSRNGEIVLTQCSDYDPDFGGRYTIKKYESEKVVTEDGWRHTKISLHPLNTDFEPIEIYEDAESQYRTIGILKCIL